MTTRSGAAVPEAQHYSACHPSPFQGYHRSNHFIATQGEYPSKASCVYAVCMCVCVLVTTPSLLPKTTFLADLKVFTVRASSLD